MLSTGGEADTSLVLIYWIQICIIHCPQKLDDNEFFWLVGEGLYTTVVILQLCKINGTSALSASSKGYACRFSARLDQQAQRLFWEI